MSDPFTYNTQQQEARPLVEFFEDAVENATKSAAAGHPAYDSVEMVKIIFPGDQFTEHTTLVKDEHRQRYAHEYSQFKAGQEQMPEGMPLIEWAAINKAWAKTLNAAKVLTVEQLASVDDGRLQHLGMGARDIRDKARRFVAQAAGSAPLDAMAARLAKLEAQGEIDRTHAESLKTENAMLRARLAEAGDAGGVGPGDAAGAFHHPLMKA